MVQFLRNLSIRTLLSILLGSTGSALAIHSIVSVVSAGQDYAASHRVSHIAAAAQHLLGAFEAERVERVNVMIMLTSSNPAAPDFAQITAKRRTEVDENFQAVLAALTELDGPAFVPLVKALKDSHATVDSLRPRAEAASRQAKAERPSGLAGLGRRRQQDAER